MRNAPRRCLAVLLSAGLLSACTTRHAIRPDYYAPSARAAKVPAKVALLTEPALPESVTFGDALVKHRIALQPGLGNALRAMLESVYEEVEVVPDAARAADAAYVVRVGTAAPEAVELKFHDAKTGEMAAEYGASAWGKPSYPTVAAAFFMVVLFPLFVAFWLSGDIQDRGAREVPDIEKGTALALDAMAARILSEDKVSRSPAAKREAAQLEAGADAAASAGDYGRALAGYARAMQGLLPGSPDALRLEEKSAKAAGVLGGLPPVPAEARRRLARGEVFFKEAASVEGYQPAIAEMRKALQLAPWWPTAHFNLGLAYEGAEQWEAAARHLKLFLAAAPGAEERAEVERKIIELEIRSERKAAAP